MTPVVKKQLFHGLRVFGMGLWVIVALMASTPCLSAEAGAFYNVAGVLNLILSALGIFLLIRYDRKAEEEK